MKFKLFGRMSERMGVDLDKVIFENDETESKKLERHLQKETMKLRTRVIEEEEETNEIKKQWDYHTALEMILRIRGEEMQNELASAFHELQEEEKETFLEEAKKEFVEIENKWKGFQEILNKNEK